MASLRRKIGFVVVMAFSAYGLLVGQAKPAPAPPAQAPDGTVKKMLDKAKQTQTEGARHADAVNAVQAAPPAKPMPQADTKSDSKSSGKKGQDKSKEMSAKEVLSRANSATQHPIGQTKDKGDPFAPPIKPVQPNVVPLNLPIGQAGLLVAQVELQGILRMASGNRAIVRGPGNRVYFLKVNDKIYNGRVTKITDDAIYLEEAVIDPFGKTQMHEVARRIPEGK